jgi:hypothetical protein
MFQLSSWGFFFILFLAELGGGGGGVPNTKCKTIKEKNINYKKNKKKVKNSKKWSLQ